MIGPLTGTKGNVDESESNFSVVSTVGVDEVSVERWHPGDDF